MTGDFSELNVPSRLLLGPGPSNVHPRVYRAMMTPVIGYLDPQFLQLLDDTQRPLRSLFRTESDLTIAISGTGSAGMEASIYNVLEPGDRAVVCVNGFFGTRMAEMARRCGAEVTTVEADWGRIIEPDQVKAALRANPGTKAVTIVHGETSTGVLQPLEEISRIVHEHGALLVVDTVTTLSGCELHVDEWGIDVCFSGTQKCLSAPPGLSPITFSPQAMAVLAARKEPVRSWYLDISLLHRYWGGGEARVYHHTPPMTMLYALREALRIALEEGLETRIARHRRHAEALAAGLEAMGLRLHAQEGYRLPPLTTVRIPEGVDDLALRRGLLQEHNIEVGGGIGAMQGQVLRIGLMGFGSSEANLLALLYALETGLLKQGFRLEPGAGVSAAASALNA